MKVIVDGRRLARLLELAGTAGNYIADLGLSVRGHVPRFAYSFVAAKRRVEASAEEFDPTARYRLKRYEDALRKIVLESRGSDAYYTAKRALGDRLPRLRENIDAG